jgi:hypothetical protein
MGDLPDYRLPISIDAVTVATIPIDIKTQTVGNLGIDIKAQTIGNLNVNITNTTINIAGSVSITGTVNISGTVSISGNVTIANATLTITGAVTLSTSSSILSISVAPNIIKNGLFATNSFAGWDYIWGATIEDVTPTGVAQKAAKLVSGGVFQYLPAFMASKLKLSVYALSVDAVANNLCAIFTFTDGTTETIVRSVQNVNWTRYFFEPTTVKRLQAVSIGWNAVVDTVYITEIIGIVVDDDLQGNNEVLPKAKGKTPIVKGAVVGNNVATVYTVTAGKIFYLVSATLVGIASAVTSSGYASLDVDTSGDGTFRPLLKAAMYGVTGSTISYCPLSLSPAVPLGFAAGTVFRVYSGSLNVEADGCIMGWEE